VSIYLLPGEITSVFEKFYANSVVIIEKFTLFNGIPILGVMGIFYFIGGLEAQIRNIDVNYKFNLMLFKWSQLK